LLRLILDARFVKELSVAEQRYQAVLAVISEGGTVSEHAAVCAAVHTATAGRIPVVAVTGGTAAACWRAMAVNIAWT
jgi:hypothetical protein